MTILLSNKLFRRLTIVDLLSTAGDVLFFLALINFAGSFKNSTFLISLITIGEALPAVFSVIIGMMSDQTSKKIDAEIYTLIIRTVLYLIIAVAFSFLNSWAVLAAILLNLISDSIGVYADGLRFPVLKSVLPSDDSQQENAFGIVTALTESVSIIAKLSGGLIVYLLTNNYMVVALINAFTFLLGAVLLRSIRKHLSTTEFKTPEKIHVGWKDLKSIWKSISIKNEIFFITILNSVVVVLPTLALIQGAHINYFNIPFAILSTIVISLETAGILMGSSFSGKLARKITLSKLIIYASFTIAILSAMGAFLFSFTLLGIFVSNFFLGLSFPKFEVMVINESDTNNGTVIGLTNTVITLFSPFVIGIFSIVAHIANGQASYILLSVVSILAALAIKLRTTLY